MMLQKEPPSPQTWQSSEYILKKNKIDFTEFKVQYHYAILETRSENMLQPTSAGGISWLNAESSGTRF